MTLTGNKQVPWDSSSIKGDFYFNLTVKNTPTQAGTVPSGIVDRSKTAQENGAWDLVKNSRNEMDFRFFLEEFPNGINSETAKNRLEELIWESVKTSTDKSKVQDFLNEFPLGANASAARIKLRQLETTSTVKAGTVRKNSIGTDLVYIPAGEFMMGSSDAEIDEVFYEAKKYSDSAERSWFSAESPKRKVTIKDGFWMGKFEVTQAEWQAVMSDNPSKFSDCGGNCPVEQVSRDDIQVFLKRLNAKNDGFEYRLPSEAEWEYAARAGTTTAFSFGNSLNSSQANFNGEYPYASTKGTRIGKTVKVGSYQPNAFGLYDMHGNVWEWVQDIYNSSYQNLSVDGSVNTSIGDSNLHVLRGGSWLYVGFDCRSASRFKDAPANRYDYFGFRVVARAKSL